jgi:regulator of replication initiation timing
MDYKKLYEEMLKANDKLKEKIAELEEEKDELEYENDYLKEDLENNTAFVDNLRDNIIKKYGDDAYNDLIYDQE